MSENLTPHRKIWDSLNICGTMRDRMSKFYTHLDSVKYSFQVRKFFRQGACVGRSGSSALFGNDNFSARRVSGCSAPSVKFGPLKKFFARGVLGTQRP